MADPVVLCDDDGERGRGDYFYTRRQSARGEGILGMMMCDEVTQEPKYHVRNREVIMVVTSH